MPRRLAVIGSMASCLLVALTGTSVPAEPVRLVMPVVYGTHLPGLGEPALRLAKLVRQLSGGGLDLDLKQPGDGTQPQEILDKVSSGSVDAGFSTASKCSSSNSCGTSSLTIVWVFMSAPGIIGTTIGSDNLSVRCRRLGYRSQGFCGSGIPARYAVCQKVGAQAGSHYR